MAKSSMIVNMKDGAILNPRAVKAFFGALPDGKNLIESDNSKKRTLPQNRYLHGVLIPEFRKALNSVGYDEVKNDSQAKLILKTMFLTRSVTNKDTGQILEFVEDTHNLTTVELNELIDEVIRFCAEHMSYIIGYPNEQLMMNYE